jgi:hypothetical protein
MKMSRNLNTTAASLVFGGILAVASVGLAQPSQTPAQDSPGERGVMRGGGMSDGMMSGNMQQMMESCEKMIKHSQMSDSSENAPSSGSSGGNPISGDIQRMMDDCRKMMNSPQGGTSSAPPDKDH